MSYKTCKKCGTPKPEIEYRKQPAVYVAKDGTHRHYIKVSNVCNTCRNEQMKKARNYEPVLKDVYYGY